MLKKALSRICIVVTLCIAAYWYFFVDMSHLPTGTLVASYPSPGGAHTVNVYLWEGSATTACAIRVEVVTGFIVRNIYWQYDETKCVCEWLSDDTVCINDRVLNVFTDAYDWRRHN